MVYLEVELRFQNLQDIIFHINKIIEYCKFLIRKIPKVLVYLISEFEDRGLKVNLARFKAVKVLPILPTPFNISLQG